MTLPTVRLRDSEQELASLLADLRSATLRQPEAAQAIFCALAREGRQYASTAEGRELANRLRHSALVERLSLVWRTATLDLVDGSDRAVPTNLIDALMQVADHPHMEAVIQQLAWEVPDRGDRDR